MSVVNNIVLTLIVLFLVLLLLLFALGPEFGRVEFAVYLALSLVAVLVVLSRGRANRVGP